MDKDLSGGQAWWDQILSVIRRADIFVFLLDADGLNSTACQREYRYAAALGKPILPVLVADGISTNLLPPELSTLQFIDYKQQDRKSAFALARALAAVPPATVLPDPLPSPPAVPISYLSGLTQKLETTSTLTYEEQSALLVDLRRSLRDPKTSRDGRALLGKLRARRDLFATIAEDIDELLGLAIPSKPVPPDTVPSTPAPPITPPLLSVAPYAGSTPLSAGAPDYAGVKGARIVAVAETAVGRAVGALALLATPNAPVGYQTARRRLMCLIAGGAAGCSVGWLTFLYVDKYHSILNYSDLGFQSADDLVYNRWYYRFLWNHINLGSTQALMIIVVAGAIAGAITAAHRRVVLIALAGFAVGFSVWFAADSTAPWGHVRAVILGGGLGAVAGALVGAGLKKWKRWP